MALFAYRYDPWHSLWTEPISLVRYDEENPHPHASEMNPLGARFQKLSICS